FWSSVTGGRTEGPSHQSVWLVGAGGGGGFSSSNGDCGIWNGGTRWRAVSSRLILLLARNRSAMHVCAPPSTSLLRWAFLFWQAFVSVHAGGRRAQAPDSKIIKGHQHRPGSVGR
ncbi:unnamed protein product, partial [Laminaria digitata]